MAAAQSAFPESYKDPLYASLDASTEQKLGLPSGLLSSVRVNGEASNHSATNEERTFSVYQFIPATRKAILDKYLIDVTLSPQNASEGAGLLLQEGLKRTGTPQGAVAQYIGGLDPANWGRTTRAYVQRVTSAIQPGAQGAAAGSADTGGVKLPPFDGQSTFDKAMAQMQQEQAPSQLQAIYQARISGQMSPEDAAQYDADVRSGAMMLPRGAALPGAPVPGVGGAVAGTSTPPLPPGVLDAFKSGRMTRQDATELERDIRAGAWQLPQGETLDSLFGAKQPLGFVGSVIDSVTGNSRRTPETDALPDWAGMPELNQPSFASFKAGLGTMLSNPAETAQVIKANAPGVQVRQDQKGNFVLRSAIDGKDYVIKPGAQWSDVPRAIGGALAFAPAAKATTIVGGALANAGTQAAIEGTQAATGGSFDAGPVAMAGAIGAAVPAVTRLVGAVRDSTPVQALMARVKGVPDPAAAATEAAVAAPATVAPAAAPPGAVRPVAAVAAPSSVEEVSRAVQADAVSSVDDVAQTLGKAAKGGAGSDAASRLAVIASPDPGKIASADRLGIAGYLQADHITTNDAFRQTVGIVKSSNPTSVLSQQEKIGLTAVAKRASDLIDEIGGTNDLSLLDATLKSRMQDGWHGAKATENVLWDKLRSNIPATTPTPATNTLAFLRQQAIDNGGEKGLSSIEKAFLAKLAPKGEMTPEFAAMFPTTAARIAAEGGANAQPTYGLVNSLRQEAGRAGKLTGTAFPDAQSGLADKLYGLLSRDQEAIAKSLGQGELVKAANAATVVRKGMESDMAALFGKRLDESLAPTGSMVPALTTAMKSAAKGNTAPLLAVLKATPDEMKQEVVASGLSTVFSNAATRGEISWTGFAKWYENLQRNQQAYTAVMSNLPPGARQQLADLALVSKGISDSLAARIATGRLNTVVEHAIEAPDTLASRLVDLTKQAGKTGGIELAASAMGLPRGAGFLTALFSAIRGNAKPNAMKAIDELLTSPEFQKLAQTIGTAKQLENVRAFAYSKVFTRFVREIGNPRELSNRERWVLQALEARNSMN